MPVSWPEGCTGAYRLAFGKGHATRTGANNFRIDDDSGGLTVSCDNDGPRHGGSTTYHLRFVDVPHPLEIHKQRGEPVIISVERQAGRVVLVGLR